MGEDCSGAVQFVTEDRLETVLSETDWPIEEQSVQTIEHRLRRARLQPGSEARHDHRGRFSLAGAQPKIALLREGDRWFAASGPAPTTHILKPVLDNFEGHIENEAFCMKLASRLQILAANVEVRNFGSERALVIERFDREDLRQRIRNYEATLNHPPTDNLSADAREALQSKVAELRPVAERQPIQRRHQEDMCQALAVGPDRKYESDGGPSIADIVTLLRQHSNAPSTDIDRLIDALAFNWFVGGSDAHAKNFSVLFTEQGRVVLSPLYDIACILEYPDVAGPPRKIRCAMQIGGEKRSGDGR